MRSLYKCSLFRGLGPDEIAGILRRYDLVRNLFPKGEIIALKGSAYSNLTIVATGTVSAEFADRNHRIVKMERITAPSLIAPGLLFSPSARLPFNLKARTVASTLEISRDDLLTMMCADKRILYNYLEIISTPNRIASEKVVYLTYKTIKGKFANYILDQTEASGKPTFRNPLTQQQMAGIFGVTRPALARAIGELAAEGTIHVHGKDITVVFEDKLRQYTKN